MHSGVYCPDPRQWTMESQSVPKLAQEELNSGLCYDTPVAGCHDGHLGESVDDHENAIIVVLSRRKVTCSPWRIIPKAD